MAKRPAKKPEPTPPEDSGSDPFAAEIAKRVTAIVGRQHAPQVVAQMVALVEERFSGPIAHPKHLREYDEIVPGAANRIIEMAEKNLAHQHEVQTRALAADIDDAKTGRRYGMIALVLLIASALVTGLMGHTVVAGMFLGTGALGTIGVLVRGRSTGD